MFGRKKQNETVKNKKNKKKKIKKNYIKYGMYQPELNIITNANGWYYRMYEVNIKLFDKDNIRKLFPLYDTRIQIIANKEIVYFLVGTKAQTVEDANNKLKIYDTYDDLKLVSADEWMSIMSEKLRDEPFSLNLDGLPEKKVKKIRKKKNLQKIQPYGIKSAKKEITVSDTLRKTMMLMSYPSKIYPSFISELLDTCDNVTVCLHATRINPDLCLKGIEVSTELSEMRKVKMMEFLTEAKDNNKGLYDFCGIINIRGSAEEIAKSYENIKKFCKKYLIGLSELEYQQSDAFKSTLPLLSNNLKYNIVLNEDNLIALFPWSELTNRKNLVHYGTSRENKEIKYNRLVNKENGLFVSTDYEWSLNQIRNEIETFYKNGNEIVNIIRTGNKNENIDGFNKEDAVISYRKCSDELLKSAVQRWSLSSISTTGNNSRRQINTVLEALNNTEPGENYIERFIEKLPEQEKRLLKNRKFPETLNVTLYYKDRIKIYCVDENESPINKTLAIAYLLNNLNGAVYLLNAEIISFGIEDLFFPQQEVLYTFTGENIRKMYESAWIKKNIKDFPFMLIGEHKTYERLQLNSLIILNKENRKWINQPAQGALLMSELVSYELT